MKCCNLSRLAALHTSPLHLPCIQPHPLLLTCQVADHCPPSTPACVRAHRVSDWQTAGWLLLSGIARAMRAPTQLTTHPPNYAMQSPSHCLPRIETCTHVYHPTNYHPHPHPPTAPPPHPPPPTHGPVLVVHRLPLDELNGHRPLGVGVVQLAGGVGDGLRAGAAARMAWAVCLRPERAWVTPVLAALSCAHAAEHKLRALAPAQPWTRHGRSLCAPLQLEQRGVRHRGGSSAPPRRAPAWCRSWRRPAAGSSWGWPWRSPGRPCGRRG